MALLDRAARHVPESTLQWVKAASDEIDHRSLGYDAVFEDLAFEASRTFEYGARDRLLSKETPPLGVYSIGLFNLEGDHLQPAVFVMPELIGVRLTDGIHVARISDSPVEKLLRTSTHELPEDVLVVAIPRPSEANSKVKAGGLQGTVGLSVWIDDETPGVLTAGHVAPTIGAEATVERDPIGSVTYTNNRSLHLHPEATADVGVIRLNDRGLELLPKSEVSGIGDATELGVLRAFNTSGVGPTGEKVRALHDRFAMDEKGAWLDIIFVSSAISKGGDSGSIVVDRDDKVVGQIVAGMEDAFSLVQDIDVLLSDSATRPRL